MFAQNLHSAYFLNSIQVSFCIVLWPAWLILHNFYLSSFWSLLVKAAGNNSPNSIMKYLEKVRNLFREQWRTRGTSMFLKVSMSMMSFWSTQLYLNLFQHLSSHNLFHLVHGEVHDEANTCTSSRYKEHKITRRTTFSWTWLSCQKI